MEENRWMYATKEEIEAMTFEEAVVLVKKTINGSGKLWGPREYYAHALQMILDKACKNK